MNKITDFLKKFILWLKTSQEETPGVASSMRIASTLVTLNIFGVWTYTSIKVGYPQKLDLNLVILLASLWGCKVAQHFSESGGN